MMMIMHEPDKKTPENGFLSLFCIFQSQQTGGGGRGGRQGRKKKGVFLLWDWSRLDVCFSRTPRCIILVMLRDQG